MAISRNPPAFPNDARIQLGDDYQGMTLRDYFAAAALQGLCGNHNTLLAARETASETGLGEDEVIAVAAGVYADAMIAEREKRDA